MGRRPDGPAAPRTGPGTPAGLRILGTALIVAATILGLAGCELTSVELAAPESVIVAEVFLEAGEAVQRALLYTSLSSTEPLPPAEVRVRPVDGGDALVYQQVAGNQCLSVEEPDSRIDGRCYTAQTGDFLVPGARYALEIRLADGRALTGQTRVPGDFTVRTPSETPCRLRGPSLGLTWTRSEGAGAYQVDALLENLAPGLTDLGLEDPPDTLRLLSVAVGAADTTLVVPAELGTFDRFDLDRDVLLALQAGLPTGARATLTLAAADANFVNWVRGGNFNPSGAIRVSSIRGDGIGAFGSLVVRRVRTVSLGADPPAGIDLPDCM